MIAGEEIITDAEHYTYTVKVIKEVILTIIIIHLKGIIRECSGACSPKIRIRDKIREGFPRVFAVNVFEKEGAKRSASRKCA